jgi:ketosteroid isomerase-like protein
MSANVETVKAIYESFGRGDVASILARLADDVQWEHDSTDHGVPWLTPRRGRASVVGFFESLSALEFPTFAPRSFLEGDRQLAAVVDEVLIVRATGRQISDLAIHLWTFDEQGVVVRFRHCVDTHQHVLAVAGAARSVA